MEIGLFKLLLLIFGLFMIDDSLWELIISHPAYVPVVVRSVFNAIGLACQPCLCFVWFLFAELRMKQKLLFKKWFIPLTIMPMIISVILIFTSIQTGLIFYSDATAEYHGPLYNLVMLFDFIYLLIVTFHAIVQSTHTKSRSAKRTYFSMIAFVLFPFVAGIFDSFVPNTPVMAPSILSALLLFFVNVQEMQIYSDALTGLNNRRRSDHMLEEYIEKAEPENGFYVFIIDVNKFKTINDRYGHIEGDHALQTVANTLKTVSAKYSIFLSRWGGDEFMIIGPQKTFEPVEDFKVLLQQEVTKSAKDLHLPYSLSISVGYSLCNSSHVSSSQLTNEADEMLYEEKRIAHQLR
jgi:diguanylate cyclase (GGDEF)-like protein